MKARGVKRGGRRRRVEEPTELIIGYRVEHAREQQRSTNGRHRRHRRRRGPPTAASVLIVGFLDYRCRAVASRPATVTERFPADRTRACFFLNDNNNNNDEDDKLDIDAISSATEICCGSEW